MSEILEFDGEGFRFLEVPTKHWLNSMTRTSDGTVLVGSRGTVLQRADSTFSQVDFPLSRSLRGVDWREEDNVLFFVGELGTFVMAKGGDFLEIPTGVRRDLKDVETSPTEDEAILVGEDGVAFVYSDGELQELTGGEGNLRRVAWRPDGEMALVAGEMGLYEFADSDKGLVEVETDEENFMSVAWKGDGETALVTQCLNPWKPGVKDKLHEFRAGELTELVRAFPEAYLSDVAWTPGETYALIGGMGYPTRHPTILKFSPEALAFTEMFRHPSYRPYRIAWRDGKATILGSHDATWWTR